VPERVFGYLLVCQLLRCSNFSIFKTFSIRFFNTIDRRAGGQIALVYRIFEYE